MRETTDVWFIAYLMKLGFKIQDYALTAEKKVSVRFNLSDEEWQKHRLDFNNSPLAEYKNIVRQIKELRGK